MNKNHNKEMQRRARQSQRDARQRRPCIPPLKSKQVAQIIPISELWPHMSRRERIGYNLLSGPPELTPIGYRQLAEAAMDKALR